MVDETMKLSALEPQEFTMELDKTSSQALVDWLNEQDKVFIDGLLNGEHGFTVGCEDGRSVDLEPVVYADWVVNIPKATITCSACKKGVTAHFFRDLIADFERCPWCGARMKRRTKYDRQ